MKIKTMFDRVEGSAAGKTFKTYDDKRGQILIKLPIPSYTRTDKQDAQRAAYAMCAHGWKNNIITEKALFSDAATQKNISEYNQMLSDLIGLASSQPVAWYWFGEGIGTTLHDLTENGNDGVISGATWDKIDTTKNVLTFDGVNDYVDIPTSINPLLRGISLNMWIKGSSTEDETFFIIFDVNNPRNAVFFRKTQKYDDFAVKVNDTFSGMNFRTDPRDGTWNSVTAIYNEENGEFKIYVNSCLDNSKTNYIGALSLSSEPANIGRDTRNKLYFRGQIGSFRLYNRALSEDEIARMYEIEKKYFL